MPYFALEINARGEIITTRGGYFDLSDREKLQKLIDIAVNSEDDIGEVQDYGLRFYRVVTRTSWRVVFADTSAETTTLHSLIRTLAIASAAALAVFFVARPAAGALAGAARCQGVGPAAAVRGGRLARAENAP